MTPHYRVRNAAGETERATECFECAPKPSRAKTYPVCTIRNTPDKPIHCIVWAKELLFARLFGRCAPPFLPLLCISTIERPELCAPLSSVARDPFCFPATLPQQAGQTCRQERQAVHGR